MHPARGRGFAPYLGPSTDSGEVLDDEDCSRHARLDNLLTQDVIAVATKPGFLAPKMPQVSLGR